MKSLKTILLLVLSITTISLSLGHFAVSIMSNQSRLKIDLPYDGLYLEQAYDKYSRIGQVDVIENSSNVLHYLEKVNGSAFKLQAKEELFIFEILVDAQTLKYLSGPHRGSHVGHLIRLPLSVGDEVEVLGKVFEVTSMSDVLTLEKDFRSTVLTLRASKIESTSTGVYNNTEIRFYDLKNGLLVRKLDLGYLILNGTLTPIYNYATRLLDSGVDADNDGLSDYVELLSGRSDPRFNDSDRDSWSDKVDPSPLDPWVPNLSIFFVAASVLFSSLAIRSAKKSR